MDGFGKAAVEVGITIGVVLSTVYVGQLFARLWAAKKLAADPQNVTAQAVLLGL
jgi:hypothetical protein